MSDNCSLEPVISTTPLRLTLNTDGENVKSKDIKGSSFGCRLFKFPIGKNRIVAIPASYRGDTPKTRFPKNVLPKFRHLGAQIATNGTFYDPPSKITLGPITGIDWEEYSKFGVIYRPKNSNLNRFGFHCDFKAETATHSMVQDSEELLDGIRMGGGLLLIHPSKFKVEETDHIKNITELTLPLNHENPNNPVWPKDPKVEGYLKRFHNLNKKEDSLSAVYLALASRPRIGVGKDKFGNWFLIAVCASEENAPVSSNPSLKKKHGYRLADLAVDLYVDHDFREVVIFDGASPFQMATKNPAGEPDWIKYGNTLSSTSSCFALTVPRQLRIIEIAGLAVSNDRPSTELYIKPPIDPPKDLTIKIDCTSMPIFGLEVTVKLAITGHPELDRSKQIEWDSDVDKKSIEFNFQPDEIAALPLELEIKSINNEGYIIDCLRFTLRSNVIVFSAIVLDDSGSMSQADLNYNAVRSGSRLARAILDNQYGQAFVNIIKFSDTATSLTGGMSSDIQAVTDAASTTNFSHSGGTDITAAIRMAINSFGGPSPREDRSILLLTDGEDPNFDSSVIADALRAGIRVHTLGLGEGAENELLQRLAFETGGDAQQARDDTELLAVMGTFDQTLSGRQLASSDFLDPGQSALVTVAEDPVFATLTNGATGVDLDDTYLQINGGERFMLSSLIADPDLVPGVHIVSDDDNGSMPNGNMSYVTIKFDGNGNDINNWRLTPGSDQINLTITEQTDPALRFEIGIQGIPQPPQFARGADPFEFDIAWLEGGNPTNPARIGAMLRGPSTQGSSAEPEIKSYPVDLEHIAEGRYLAKVDPSKFDDIAPGIFRLMITGFADGGVHQRQLNRSFVVYDKLDVDIDDLPQVAVAEEYLEHSISLPKNMNDARVTLTVDDGNTTKSGRLLFQGVQSSGSVYSGKFDIGTLAPTLFGQTSIEVRRGSFFAREDGTIAILGTRGAWLLTQGPAIAIDLKANKIGTIAPKKERRVQTQAMDGFNGALWRAEKILTGNQISDEIYLRKYDRSGLPVHEITALGIEIFNLVSYDDIVATIEVIKREGKRISRLVLYSPGHGGAYAEQSAIPGMLMMSGKAKFIYYENNPDFGSLNKLMQVLGVTEPEVIKERIKPHGVDILLMPDGKVGEWHGQNNPIRSIYDQNENLTEALNGESVETDALGFWLTSNSSGLTRYTFDPVTGLYNKNSIQPDPHLGIDKLASSRVTGVAVAVRTNINMKLMRIQDSMVAESDIDILINRILANNSFYRHYPPFAGISD